MTRVPPTASPVRTARRKNVSLAFTGALLVIMLATGVAQAAAVTVGYRDFAYDPGQASRATADTQQSKLWFAGGLWYGGFYSSADNSFNIFRLDQATHTWADSHIIVDTRDRVHGDYLFDAATNKLWVVSTKSPCTSTTNNCNDGVRVSRYSFNAASPTIATRFTLDAGFPSTIFGGLYNGVSPSAGGAETVTIAKDATNVYVAWTRRSAASAQPSATSLSFASLAAPTTWSAPVVINAGEDGQSNVSALVSFGTSVGVYYTDAHSVGSDTGLFRVHNAGDPGGTWQAPETASASSTNNQASVKADAAGNVYVAYKTNAGVGTSAQISLLRRTSGGTWTGRGVSDVDSTNTRAQVAIDPTFNGGLGLVFVIMNPTDDVDGNIYYKSAPLTGGSALTFTLPGRGTRLIDSATDNDIEDATTTKQILTQASGLVVSATDKTSKFYLHNELALSDAADVTGPTGTVVINAGAVSTKLTAATAVMSATDANAVVNMRYGVSPDGTTCPTTGTPELLTTGTTIPYTTAAQAVTLSAGDGVKAVCAQFQDLPGNWSAPVLDQIILDTTGPVGAVIINGGDASTTLATVSLDVTATDVTGPAFVRISNVATVDGNGVLNGAGSETRAYAETQTWTLTPGDGVKTVYVQWQDGLGTWSGVSNDTITLDSVNTTYTEVTPVRVLDSRVNNPGGVTIFSHGVPQSFSVAGRTIGAVTIPADAVAITGNLTVVGSTAAGFVTLGPDVPVAPDSSTINFPKGDTRANGVFVPLDGTGNLEAVYRANGSGAASKKTHLALDVTGYFRVGTAGNEYFPVTPSRYLDTRSNNPGGAHILNPSVPYAFQVTGRTVGSTTIPADAVAITGNLTVTGQTKGGFLSLTPDSQANPTTSTLNFPATGTRANNVTVKLGAGGNLYVVYKGSGKAHAILDITGYFRDNASGLSYVPVTPTRTVDTREDLGIFNPLQASAPKSWTVRGFAGVESDAKAFTGNLTVTGQTKGGFISVTPTPDASPATSTINFPVGDARANGIAAPINDADGKSSVVYKPSPNSGHVEFIVDITGYFH